MTSLEGQPADPMAFSVVVATERDGPAIGRAQTGPATGLAADVVRLNAA